MATATYDFSNQTVALTGATSGIGRAVALRFADAGATVLNGDVGRDPKDAEVPTDEAIEAAGGTAEFVECDVTEREDLRTLVDRAREYGGLDVMVNNAGIHLAKPMTEVTPDEFDRLHAVNSRGTYFGTQVAAQDMLDRDDPGAIVNTASISSNLAQHDQVQYDSTKGSVRMITRGAALEFGEHGIRVNGVAPGQIATEINEGWSDKARDAAANDDLLKPVPLSRAGEPADLPGAYLFLASDDAAYVTGELLHVDGGWQIC
jgi:NAD(P)-dependent dehydrogenase (short-subunit alcohol dehydrogenase family)